MMGAGGYAGAGGYGGGPLSLEIGIWDFLGRSLLMMIGLLLVIPAPWVATMLLSNYVVERVRVPGRPNLAFTGQVGDIACGISAARALQLCRFEHGYSRLSAPSDIWWRAYLCWMVIRWIVSQYRSNGQKLRIEFKGSAIGYIGCTCC